MPWELVERAVAMRHQQKGERGVHRGAGSSQDPVAAAEPKRGSSESSGKKADSDCTCRVTRSLGECFLVFQSRCIDT